MSLKVWLPLTKDLNNQGLSDVTITNYGATYSSNGGKLGGCYTFDGNDYIRISMPSDMTTLKRTSVAAWVKSTSSTLALGGISNDVNYTVPMCTLYTSGWQFGNDTQNGYRYLSGGTIANTGVWHHVCCTISDTTITTYLDGVQITSGAISGVTTFTSANFIEIGCDHPGGDEYFTGSVNDFRVYDHQLSPKEVKEIAKGLVVHYPLSREGFGGDNVINGTSSTEVQYTYLSTSFNDFYNRKTTIVPSASQYILSFDAKSTVAGDKIRAHYYNPNTTTRCESSQGIVNTASDGNMDFTLSTEWEKYWVVYTQSSTTAAKNVILPRMCSKASGMAATGSGTVSIKRVKFEEGNKPTPWIPNQSDTAYAAMGLNDDVVYDTSGFSYNATKSGTFEYTSDTPKYSVSTKLLTTSSKIRLPEISFAGMANSYTFSWWQYYNGGGTMPWGFSNGNRLNFYHCSPVCWNTGDGASNPFKNGSTTLPPANLQNGWHHIAVTGDGTTTKLYIDGEYFGNATTYRPITGTQIWISGWDSGTSYTFSGGKLSDFRIYATCLSASDIQQLYNTPISLANNGTLFANELTEV